jgi:hypothetical protein
MDPENPKDLKYFDIPIFGGRVILFDNKGRYNEYRLDIGVGVIDLDSSNGRYDKLVGPNKQVVYMCGVFNGQRSALVHELYHISSTIIDDTGIGHGGETGAYLIGYIMEQVENLEFLESKANK